MLTKAESRLLHALKSRSGREKNDAFVVEGIRALEELLASGIDLNFAIVSPSLEDSGRGRALSERLAAHATVRRVRDAELRALTDTTTPQGVIAIARIPHPSLTQLRPSNRAVVLVLDAIQDPGNLGTLIRSADAFAIDCVIALPGSVDYWNPKVVRSAAGAAFRVPLITESEDAVWRWLEQHAFQLYDANMQGADVGEVKERARVALVVGNEGAGLRAETRKRVHNMIAIPMPGRAESLNVAVAAGILLYELSKTN
jgi:TrmH family RNA methyltransferase